MVERSVISLYGLLYCSFTSIGTAQASAGFKDVPNNHWSYKAIMDLANKNVVAGYGNGIFGFGDDVTREQVAALM
ncbi:S-layer homology domain-containing protein, partial [Bacillus sp. B-TM1]